MTDALPAVLALSNGAVFNGRSRAFGAAGDFSVGEVVFNTAMTGYQEVITDPSYSRQIVNFTYPHIGNTGVCDIDNEASQTFIRGIVARRIARHYSNWRANRSLPDELRARQIIAIDGADTRAITRCLRDGGAQAGCLMILQNDNDQPAVAQAIRHAQNFEGLSGAMLLNDVTGDIPTEWPDGIWQPHANRYAPAAAPQRHIVLLDCGAKRNILRELTARGCRVTAMPFDSDAAAVAAARPDGIIISNGPGDPEVCAKALANARQWLADKIPLFGLCLGHQIIALAMGAQTIKMKFGHHGANHPVRAADGTVMITSQNHGFAVAAESLPRSAQVTHTSLFDGSLQGVRSDDPPVITFQGHPEASPGPHDAAVLFDAFARMVDDAQA